MNKKFSFLLVAICCFMFTVQAQQNKRIYMIGNSLTDNIDYDGFSGLIQSRGNTITLGSQRIPGSPLSFLWANPEGGFTHQPFGVPQNAFTVYSWDYLSLQPFDRGIEGAEGDKTMIGNYYNLIKSKSPDCKVSIYGHWPRTPNNKSYLECTKEDYNNVWLSTTGNEARKFYEDLTLAVRAVYPATASNIIMAPIGEVMYELNNNTAFLSAMGMTSIWGVFTDGIHLNGVGEYISSCVNYALMYHDDPAGLGVPGAFGSIPAAALPYIHQAVKDVIIAKSLYTGISYFGPAPVLSVKLNATAMELNTTKTATLTPVFTPSNAANKSVSWNSSNTGVATVVDGVVTAQAVGTTNITVTTADGGFQSVCAVTVVNVGTAVTGVTLNKATTSILVSASETLTTTIAPSNATNNSVVWSSSDNSIATVSTLGVVTAVKKGVTVISVCTVNGLFTASCTVTVTQVNNPPVAVMKVSPGLSGYAPYKVVFDGRSSTDPDPDDFVLGYDWVVKVKDASTNLRTESSNGFDYTFTTPGVYEVTLQAVDNAEQRRSLNTEKVTITILAMPTVPAAETAICYEGFDYIKAPITNFNGGRGWKQGWLVQDEAINTVNDFAVDNVAPITVTNLRQAGNYMKLGQGYSGIGRPLDISANGAFKNYLNANGNIGKADSTLWFSTIIRPQGGNKNCSVSFSNDGSWWTNNDKQKVDFGCFGGNYWGFAFGWDAARVYNMSTVPVVNDVPAFLVAKVEFGATTNTVTLYINPAPGTAPTGTPVIGTTTSNIEFKTVGMAFSNGSNKMGVDEIRFGRSYEDVAPLSTPDNAAPTTPTGLAVGTIGSTSVVLNWNASENAVGTTTYDVYKGGTLAGSTTSTTYTATGLAANTLYSFTVVARDGFGSSAATAAVSATTTAPVVDVTAPTVPTGLAAGTITSSSIVLNWTASTDAIGVTGYDVYQGATLIASPTANTYTVTGLTANTSYSFTVRAKDAANNISDASSVLNVTTSTDTPVVSGVIATWNLTGVNNPNGALSAPVTSKDANLTISNLSKNAGMGGSGAGFPNSINGTGVTATSLAEAISNNEYLEFTITPAAGKSVSITSLDLSAMSQGRTATCTLLSSVAGFAAGSSVSSLALGNVNEVNISNQTITVSGHTNLTSPVTFRFYFHAVVNQNYFAFGIGQRHTGTATADLIVKGSVSGTTDLSGEKSIGFKLYPNPSEDMLIIDFGSQVDKAEIRILDMQGRTVMAKTSANNYQEVLNVADLKSGIYFVKVVNNGEIKNSRFVKK